MAVTNPSVAQIREQDYVLGKMSPDEEQVLTAKNLMLYEHDTRFWSPSLELGRTCFDAVVGSIFTDPELEDYKKKEKIIVTNPELIPKLNALEGIQIAGRRDGIVVPRGGEDAPDTEAIVNIMKSIHAESHYKEEATAAFIDGMISSYPSFMLFERAEDWARNKSLDVFHPPWDSMLPDPMFKRREYSDGQRLSRVILFDKESLKRKYPKRIKEIDATVHMNNFDAANLANSTTFSSSERDNLYYKSGIASQTFDRTGQVIVIERSHFLTTQATIWISPEAEQPEILPQEWSQEEVQRWVQQNPSYKSFDRQVRILWVTTCTSTALLLENNRHWYQENRFPAEMYIPKMVNNKPHGMVEFLTGPLKGKNVARIEHLHSLRLANDQLWKIKAGKVDNAKDLPAEVGKAGGMIIIAEDGSMDDVEAIQNRRENLGWTDAAEQFQGDLDRIFLDRNVEGGKVTSQESGKAIEKRVAQGQMKQSPYLDTYNGFDLRNQKTILKLLPYIFTEHHIFHYIKDDNTEEEVEVNAPDKFDWQTGATTRVKNNLAGAKYDYMEAHGDNSVTGREHELKVFQEVLHNVLPSMPDVSLWPALLSSIPNRLTNEFGRKIQSALVAQAEQGEDEATPPKLSFSFTGDDLLHNPIAIQVLQEAGYATEAQPPPGGQPAPAEAAQPSETPTPEASLQP